LIPPTVPEVRRLIRAMMGPEEKREFRLGWSLFRRTHQAVAKRCHEAAHRAKHATDHDGCRRRNPELAESSEVTAPTTPTHALKAGLLADEHWELIRELLPRQEPGQGRPRRDVTDRCFAGYCGSWTPALRGEIYQRRTLGPTAQFTVGTASGAKKGSGLG
jgi:hypothetical protein